MDLERLKEITLEIDRQANEKGMISFRQLNEASSLVIATLAEYYQERISDASSDDAKDFINKVLKISRSVTD